MNATVLFAGVPTADFRAALPWYERLMGRPPDMLPHESEATWQVSPAGWIYIVADTARAGRALVTLIVDDLDARLAQLGERGLSPTAIEVMPGVGRKVTFTDPEGNAIALAEVVS
ncbi:MAG TPA: VOC family protein [Candidatus Dormibacteraeota bacterium]